MKTRVVLRSIGALLVGLFFSFLFWLLAGISTMEGEGGMLPWVLLAPFAFGALLWPVYAFIYVNCTTRKWAITLASVLLLSYGVTAAGWLVMSREREIVSRYYVPNAISTISVIVFVLSHMLLWHRVKEGMENQ